MSKEKFEKSMFENHNPNPDSIRNIKDKEIYKTFNNNVAEEVVDIIKNRHTEKAKAYGPMHESHEKAAKLLTIMIGKPISTRDYYMFTIVLKLSRLIYSDKRDTYVDLVSNLTTMQDFMNDKNIKE